MLSPNKEGIIVSMNVARRICRLLLTRLLLFGALLSCSPRLASSAGPVTYAVTVNTSSISGTVGSFDFNFNPGPLVSQTASVQITTFTSNGTLQGGPTLTGDASGALPAPLTFDNGTAFNDYFQGFTFGSTLSFNVTLSGPALSSPDGVSTSGSTFAFSMFSDTAGTMPALTTDALNGFAFKVDVNLDGTTTVTDFSSQTAVHNTSSITATPILSPPALAALALLLGGMGALAARQSTRGIPKTLALVALVLSPLGSGLLRLSSAQAQEHPNSGTANAASSLTLLKGTQVSSTASGLAYSRSSQTFNGTVTITNISTTSIAGPFQIAINSLTAGVTLTNATGSYGGVPYLTVAGAGSLAAGQSASVSVQFRNPSNTMIKFSPIPYSGSFN